MQIILKVFKTFVIVGILIPITLYVLFRSLSIESLISTNNFLMQVIEGSNVEVFNFIRIPLMILLIWKMELILQFFRVKLPVDRSLKLQIFVIIIIIESIMIFKGY